MTPDQFKTFHQAAFLGAHTADDTTFASICAEDHSAIWLNNDTWYIPHVRIANENTTNGLGGEPSQ